MTAGSACTMTARLDELPADKLVELAQTAGDTKAMFEITTWLENKHELDEAHVEKLLKRLPLLFYERHRKGIAKKLEVRAGILDQLRGIPAKEKQTGQGTPVVFDEPKPWSEPVDGGTLLDDLAGLFKKYIILPEGAVEALALWTAFAWLHDEFQISPLLCITSPQKRCGKTSLLAVLGQLVPRPLPAANMTPATVYRAVEVFSPTLLADEVDTYFRDNQELRGVLNAGHLRSQAYVMRCAEPDFEARLFKIWAPKAIALIGRLVGPWSTLADRSIVLQLQRKRADEPAERLRLDRLSRETEELRRKLARWSADFRPVIAELEPPEPDFLNDRAADNWRPLFTIAAAASDSFRDNQWIDRAREAARLLSTGADDDDMGTLLLSDLQALFAERGVDRLGSQEIVQALGELEDRPWPEYRAGRSLSKKQLASILGKFGVKPQSIKLQSGAVHRGYHISALEPVFIRYCATKNANSLQQKELVGSRSVAGSISEVLPVEQEKK